MEGEIANIVKEVRGSRWADYMQLEASGKRGDTVIMWDKRIRDMQVNSWEHIQFLVVSLGRIWILNGTQ